MNIPYPCPKPLEEMKSTKNGFYCNDCGHTLIDLRTENATLPLKGSCVVSYEEVEDKKTAEINTSYRFALALFIVMGSSFIINNSAQAQYLLDSVNTIKENASKVDTTLLSLSGNISDFKGKPIKPVQIKITLANGQIINSTSTTQFRYNIGIPAHQLNKTIVIEYFYYDDNYSLEYLVEKGYNSVPEVKFKRNKKDKFTKKRYPKPIKTVGYL